MPSFSTPTHNVPNWPKRGLAQFYKGSPVGYSVLITAGVATPFPGIRHPNRELVDAADAFFQGGLKHTVTESEKTILEAAGYTVG